MEYKNGDIILSVDMASSKYITKVSLANYANCIPIESGVEVIVDISVLTDIINSAVMDIFHIGVNKKEDNMFSVIFTSKKIQENINE